MSRRDLLKMLSAGSTVVPILGAVSEMAAPDNSIKPADLERATFSNIEEQNIRYYTETICPWLVRWEQCLMAQ